MDKNRMNEIEEEELRKRCELSSKNYDVADDDKKKMMKASAMSLSLNRWVE